MSGNVADIAFRQKEPWMIPESHPLQQLFIELVGRHYAEEIGIRDPQIVNYVSHLLAEFCDAEQLFKIRNARCVNTSAITRCFLPACSRRASTTFACAASGWKALWTG